MPDFPLARELLFLPASPERQIAAPAPAQAPPAPTVAETVALVEDSQRAAVEAQAERAPLTIVCAPDDEPRIRRALDAGEAAAMTPFGTLNRPWVLSPSRLCPGGQVIMIDPEKAAHAPLVDRFL